MEEYDIIEIQGKNSKILLHVPKKEATEEEVNELHKAVSEVIVNINKDSKKAAFD
ncbi:MAG: hypothetical protein K0S80_2334 [Neobacillus sp.]|nr:hypothetical protein [Neobacillus sp.]